MKKIFAVMIMLLGLTFADTLQKDYAYVISAIGIKNVEGNVVWQSGNSNQLANGTYKLVPQVIIYDGKTEYVGAATPFTGCLNGRYYNSAGAPDGACFAGGVATSSQNGLMSAADKTKLDGISESADSVSFSRSLSSGTKIGSINVNGTSTDMFAPTDTNTTYSAGTGISLSGTTFSNSGVRSVSTGSSNGTISVNTNGSTANVSVKGLGSAAYTNFDLLWTNSSYSSAFNKQTLPLNLTNYDRIYIVTTVYSCIIGGTMGFKGLENNMGGTFNGSSKNIKSCRKFTFNNNGITFEDGYSDGEYNQQYSKPYKIYGIR